MYDRVVDQMAMMICYLRRGAPLNFFYSGGNTGSCIVLDIGIWNIEGDNVTVDGFTVD